MKEQHAALLSLPGCQCLVTTGPMGPWSLAPEITEIYGVSWKAILSPEDVTAATQYGMTDCPHILEHGVVWGSNGAAPEPCSPAGDCKYFVVKHTLRVSH